MKTYLGYQMPDSAEIIRLAEDRGWSEIELARRSRVSRATLVKALGGQRVQVGTLRKLAAAFGVTARYITKPSVDAPAPDGRRKVSSIDELVRLALPMLDNGRDVYISFGISMLCWLAGLLTQYHLFFLALGVVFALPGLARAASAKAGWVPHALAPKKAVALSLVAVAANAGTGAYEVGKPGGTARPGMAAVRGGGGGGPAGVRVGAAAAPDPWLTKLGFYRKFCTIDWSDEASEGVELLIDGVDRAEEERVGPRGHKLPDGSREPLFEKEIEIQDEPDPELRFHRLVVHADGSPHRSDTDAFVVDMNALEKKHTLRVRVRGKDVFSEAFHFEKVPVKRITEKGVSENGLKWTKTQVLPLAPTASSSMIMFFPDDRGKRGSGRDHVFLRPIRKVDKPSVVIPLR